MINKEKRILNKRNILAIVSGVADEINLSERADDNSIARLKNSGLFDSIVIASPDDKSSDKIIKLAKYWGVDYHAGSIYDIRKRFKDVIDEYEPDIICRVQLRACWIDIKLVTQAIDLLVQGYDFIDYGLDVNYAMGADVFTKDCFIRVNKMIDEMSDGIEKNTYQFSPWALMQNKQLFKVGTINKTKLYTKSETKAIRHKLDKLIGHNENQIGVDPNEPGSRYTNVKQYIGGDDVVLDIACGQGGGTYYLSKYCSVIHGIDSDEKYIIKADQSFGGEAVIFHHGTDAILAEIKIEYDKIVSLHTLEHVENDKLFLTNLRKYLKPEGILILEVPRLFKYPLGEPLWPFHKKEYSYEELKSLLETTGYKILEEKGGNRHRYVQIKHAREVLFFVARKDL